MPAWAIALIINIVPRLLSLVIRHYERKEDELDLEARAKLDQHRTALSVLKPNLTNGVNK